MNINEFTVYNKRGYTDLVAQAAELSMKAAFEEVQLLPHYEHDLWWGELASVLV